MPIAIAKPLIPHSEEEFDEAVLDQVSSDEWLEVENNHIKEQSLEEVYKLRAENSRFESCVFTGQSFEKIELHGVTIQKSDMSNLRTYQASLQKTILKNLRATGADFPEAEIKDCLFKDVKFDNTGFKLANLKRVRFENCILKQADFYKATLHDVTFSGCELEGANFDQATFRSVDFRGENIAQVKGIASFRGAIISNEQLYQIAPLIAAEIGFVIG